MASNSNESFNARQNHLDSRKRKILEECGAVRQRICQKEIKLEELQERELANLNAEIVV